MHGQQKQEYDTTTLTTCSGKFSSFNIKMKEKPQPGFNCRETPCPMLSLDFFFCLTHLTCGRILQSGLCAEGGTIHH